MIRIPVRVPHRRYEVLVGAGLLDRVDVLLDGAGLGGPAVVVTDGEVGARFGGRVVRALRRTRRYRDTVVVPRGERAKRIQVLARLYTAFARAGLDRSAVVIALGGGSVGDLAGFAAATWMRGIAVVHLPTTLLAQVDSSIGGKTAIDIPAGKNLVGAFHQPRLVVADVDTLASLPDRERRAGLAEVVKTALIGDRRLFGALERTPEAFRAGEPVALRKAVEASVRVKGGIVARDEREGGLRMLLNYGHTVGHGIEAAAGYGRLPHGYAVAVGMSAEAWLGERLGVTPVGLGCRQDALLEGLGLPVVRRGLDPARVLAHAALDKKRRGASVVVAVPSGIGFGRVIRDVPARLFRAAIRRAVGRG